MVYIALVNTGDDVKGKRGNPTRPPLNGGYIKIGNQFDGASGSFEGKGVLAKPNMIGFESVAGNGNGTESGVEEFVELLFRECESVGNHAPRVAALMQGLTYLSEVFAHKGFPTGDDDEYLVGIDVRSDLCINDVQEILRGHIRCDHGGNTITSTMEAMYITTKG
jgi:hypothetical protein